MRAVVAAAVVALALAACDQPQGDAERAAGALTGGDAARGREAIDRYGCGGCHEIPGVAGARGRVGPPLAGIATRLYLAGKLPNSPENLIQWIRHPQRIDPGVVMPEMGVTERDARDIATHLLTLR